MKATLATLACLLTVGFLSAASVEGNNTAVVIRKNVVKSDNGYQFLCVPVNPLKIDGSTVNADGSIPRIKLSTFLPPATLSGGTKITYSEDVVSETGIVTQTCTYTVVTPNDGTPAYWAVNASDNTMGFEPADPELLGGTIFWLHDAVSFQSMAAFFNSAPADAKTVDKPIVFCGQDRELTVTAATSGAVTPMSNDSSVAIKLGAFRLPNNTMPGHLDQILTIKAGSSEYNIYRYLDGIWYGSGANNDCSEVEIAPGEAFYYYKSNSQQ